MERSVAAYWNALTCRLLGIRRMEFSTLRITFNVSLANLNLFEDRNMFTKKLLIKLNNTVGNICSFILSGCHQIIFEGINKFLNFTLEMLVKMIFFDMIYQILRRAFMNRFLMCEKELKMLTCFGCHGNQIRELAQ